MIAVGWFVGGESLAKGVSVCGIAVIANMAILNWLTRGYISSIVSTGRGGLAALGMTLKLWLSMSVFWYLMTVYGPLSVFLSWISVVLGVASRGIWLYVRLSTGVDVEGPA
jgi:hypothetical protein